ncbi:MAG: hypothetical protein ACI81R_001387 [Bradymonadia bacterium]|jgi:hypothetical protein
MGRLSEENTRAAFASHLQPEETLQHVAMGIKQPSMLLIFPLYLLALLPGIIAVFLLTKTYYIGLTDRRLIILRVSNGKYETQEVREFPLSALPGGATKTGALFTHITLNAEPPFVAKFHRAVFSSNRPGAMAIGARVSGTALPVAE